MQILTATGTSYPRLGKNSIGHELRGAWHEYDNGQKSIEDVRRVEHETAREILEEQEKIGIDLVNDGCVRWYCPVSHIAGRMSEVRKGALHHFLDTNLHVRKVVVEDLPAWKEPLVLNEFLFSTKHTLNVVSPVLTGPATLLYYTKNLSGHTLERIGFAYAEVLAKEIQLLREAGAMFVHIDDPLILEVGEDLAYFREVYSLLSSAAHGVRLIIKTYGAKSSHLIHELISLPCDVIGVDCISDPLVPEFFRENREVFCKKNFALGIVDSRNILIEDAQDLALWLESVLPLSDSLIFLEPSYGLEYLPRRYARKKLETLVLLKKNLAQNLEEVKRMGWRRE